MGKTQIGTQMGTQIDTNGGHKYRTQIVRVTRWG